MECREDRCRGSSEQFRATKAWNMIVSAVREDLPVGRHRKGLKHFDNCFSGDEAVSWTLHFLQENYDLLFAPSPLDENCAHATGHAGHEADITREKVAHLLQKFIEQKIIEDVRGHGESFQDSPRQLYTFNNDSSALKDSVCSTAHLDSECFHDRHRSASVCHIHAPSLRFATSLVKVAIFGLSSSSHKEQHGDATATVRT